MATYYVAVNGQHTGPYTIDQMVQLGLTPDTLVWNDSMPNWTPAGQIAELQSLFYAAPQPAAFQQQAYPQQTYPQQFFQRSVSFSEAISRFFSNYATFTGRASRSEFWFAVLFNFIVATVLSVFDIAVGTLNAFVGIYYLATLIPNLAIQWRRLHDTGRSGAWFFIGLIPLVGGIILLVYDCQESQPYENEYGPVPNVE